MSGRGCRIQVEMAMSSRQILDELFSGEDTIGDVRRRILPELCSHGQATPHLRFLCKGARQQERQNLGELPSCEGIVLLQLVIIGPEGVKKLQAEEKEKRRELQEKLDAIQDKFRKEYCDVPWFEPVRATRR
eukprot:TRINITY_DN92947_c0_g1_i1.p1 TRINITY_DN92947_c0_g1~~TRINITY_DN92947_c0_g1_i1.p1  ORF type:complete len:152 (-),score=23.03 TRINITY_DN92947_c0_g1_i1:230-625(-)